MKKAIIEKCVCLVFVAGSILASFDIPRWTIESVFFCFCCCCCSIEQSSQIRSFADSGKIVLSNSIMRLNFSV